MWYVRLDREATAASADSGLPFADIGPDDELRGIIGYLYENGLMKGVSETEFDKTMSLTRAMIVTILHRMEDSPAAEYTGAFRDVKQGEWYTNGVEWAAANGIVMGYDNGNFGPVDPVTREPIKKLPIEEE